MGMGQYLGVRVDPHVSPDLHVLATEETAAAAPPVDSLALVKLCPWRIFSLLMLPTPQADLCSSLTQLKTQLALGVWAVG